MEREKILTARVHESGHYFFCPHCSLSFPHPPSVESFYLIGHGFCWYCAVYVPLEGGDKNGVAGVGEDGEVYVVLYEAGGGERRVSVEECIRAQYSRSRPGEGRRRVSWELLPVRSRRGECC